MRHLGAPCRRLMDDAYTTLAWFERNERLELLLCDALPRAVRPVGASKQHVEDACGRGGTKAPSKGRGERRGFRPPCAGKIREVLHC